MKVVVEIRETEWEGAQAMRSQKERGGEDQFRLLPDELLVLILNKVAEAKWLCRCSTVSKRFASVVFHTHTISIKMPQFQKRILGPEETPILQQKASLHLLSKFLDPFKGVFKFLSNFRDIHSLNIDFPAYGELGQEDMFKWEAYFGTELESFTIVLSSSICKMMNPLEEEEEEQQEEEPGSEIRMDLWIQRVRQAFECLNDAFLRHLILLFMVAQVKSIQSAAIMDSRNGVKLYVGNKQLSHLTDLVNETTIVPLMELAEHLPKCLKVCHVPELRLPLCGYVMKRAVVVIVEQVDEKKQIDKGDTGYVHGVIGGGFEGVEKAFEEAVTEMLMNHGDKMQTINFP